MFWKKKTEPTDRPVGRGTSTSSTSTTTTTHRTANGGIATTTTTYSQQIISRSTTGRSTSVTSQNPPRFPSAILDTPDNRIRPVFEKPKLTSDATPFLPSSQKSTTFDEWAKLKMDARPIQSSQKPSTFDDWPKSNVNARPFQSSQTRSAFGGQPLHSYNPRPSSNPSVNPAPLTKNNPTKPVAKSEQPSINQPPSSTPIKVKKTYEFNHDPNSKVPTYSTTSKQRGSLLIINNIEFSGKRREGADIDEANMKELFKQMGFTVRAHQNKKKRDMERIIREYKNQGNLKKVDISVTIIMSHGNRIGEETHIETIDGQTITTEWVVQQFASSNCEHLRGKPKIFIFQCCRGDGEDIQTDAKVFQQPRAQEDILIAYATVPGYVSYRVPGSGSWYINRIRDVFMEHAHDTHIEDLLKIVDDGLARENNKFKQTSSYESRGFKKCYLNPV